MRWTDELRMETPEQIEVDLELAGLGSRFFAKVIDVLLKILLSLMLVLLSAILLGALGRSQIFENPSKLVIALVLSAFYILWLGYGIYFEVRWNGQTPGKWWAGIRVLREGGAPLDFQAAAIRNLLAIADFLPLFYLLGSLLILLTPRRQRLSDMAAGTIVVRERKVDLGTEPEEALLDYASEEYAFTHTQLANLTPADRTVLREFLRRNEEMKSRDRSRLARKLAESFLKRTGYPLEEDFHSVAAARTFLASLLRDLSEFLRHS
jgi:uncharacterized RDD family membrane protein YckC